MAQASVKVALRVRPLTAKEQMSGCAECIGYVPGSPEVVLDSTRAFTYDFVYSPDTAQQHVFDTAVRPVLARFVEGYNATCLAYGQTGSGKTHTMGTGFDVSRYDTTNQGIIPRAIDALFEALAELGRKHAGYKYQMFASFLELYNEELVDLLNPQSSNKAGGRRGTALTIREDGQGGIYWAGIKEEPVATPDELLSCLQKGSLSRTTGSTDMNLTSSRSHAIFSIVLRQEIPSAQSNSTLNEKENAPENQNSGTGDVTKLNSKFHFVDLAGSERMKKTKAVGERAKEGIAINSGLLAMGKVIHALNDSATHVPYRDSKLTRLLQDSLGGNSQTLMIACVSGSDSNFGETLNTLNYASRARNIKNKVMINQDFQAMEIHQLRAEISRLKMDLMTSKSSNRGSMQNISAPGDDPSNINSIPIRTAQRLKNENDLLKQDYQQKEMTVFRLQRQVSDLQQELADCQSKLDTLLLGGADPAAIEVNPIVARYNTTITELKARIADLEAKLEASQREQASRLMMAASADSIGSTFYGVSGNLLASSSTGLIAVADPNVNQTIEKAKREIKKDIMLLQQRKRHSPSRMLRRALKSGAAASSSEESDNASSGEQPERQSDNHDDSDLDSDDDESEGEGEANPTAAEDEMLQMIDQIQKDISVKEELVEQLEKTQTDFHVMKEKFEDKLRQLQDNLTTVQKQRDSALKGAPDSSDPKEKVQLATLKTRYEEKIKKLSAEISDVRRKYQESQKEIQSKRNSNEAMLRTMKTHIESLKQEKMRALKKMKEREAATRERDLLKDREIGKLKRREKHASEMAQKLERSNHMQKLMLKRRTEEQAQTQNKLRSVMSLLRKTKPVQSPIAKKTWRGFPGHESPRRSGSSSSISLRGGQSAVTNTSMPALSPSLRRTLFGPSQESMLVRDEERLRVQASFKKNLIDNQVTAIISEKHRMTVADELLAKREALAREKHDLVEELESLEPVLSAESAGDKVTFLKQQRQEVVNRLDIVDAEMKYCSARMRSIQIESAQEQSTGEVTGLESALDVVQQLDPVEAVRVIELMLEDNIALRLGERTHQIETQQLKRDVDALRKTIEFYRTSSSPASSARQPKLANRAAKLLASSPSRNTTAVVNNSAGDHDFDADFDAIDSALGAMASPASTRTGNVGSPSRRRSQSTDVETREIIKEPAVTTDSSFEHNSDSPAARRVPSLQNIKERSGNVFERLHREQTVASQAKMKEHITHLSATVPTPSSNQQSPSVDTETTPAADNTVAAQSPTSESVEVHTEEGQKVEAVAEEAVKVCHGEPATATLPPPLQPAATIADDNSSLLDKSSLNGGVTFKINAVVAPTAWDIDSLTTMAEEDEKRSTERLDDSDSVRGSASGLDKLMSLRGSIQRAMNRKSKLLGDPS